MKTSLRISLLAAAVAGFLCTSTDTLAQQQGGGQGGQGGRGQRGNFDPAQMQERMMARYREMLEITADDEWKAIEPMVAKINEARRDIGMGGMGRMMRPPGGQGGPGAQGGGRRGFGGDPAPEEEALQKAVDSKASSADLKTAMAKMRDARKAKEAKLAAAQDNLRKVLSARQEAQAMLAGLLN